MQMQMQMQMMHNYPQYAQQAAASATTQPRPSQPGQTQGSGYTQPMYAQGMNYGQVPQPGTQQTYSQVPMPSSYQANMGYTNTAGGMPGSRPITPASPMNIPNYQAYNMTPQRQQQMQALLQQQALMRMGYRVGPYGQTPGVSSWRSQQTPTRRKRTPSPEDPPTPPDEYDLSESDDGSESHDGEEGAGGANPFVDGDDDWKPGMTKKKGSDV